MASPTDTWEVMHHWHLVLPPSRPSTYQLDLIRSCCAAIPRQAPVAVLGSTPECRDLLYECGFVDVSVIDRNAEFFSAMSTLRVYSNQERFLEGDWLDVLPQHPSEFAFVVSDLTSGNVDYDVRPLFYRELSSALLDGGFFFDKVLTHPGPLLSVASIVEKYAYLPVNLVTINRFSCEMFFCSELLDHAGLVDSSAFYAHLDRVVQHPRVRRFANEAKLITPPGCTWWYGRRWPDLSPDYCPSLTRVAIWEEEATSPYFERLKYFCLRKETIR